MSGQFEALRRRARQEIDEGLLPACQYAVAIDGKVVLSETLGTAPADARFSIWSATKPVFASVVWQLIGEGLVDPEAPVTDIWPEFGAHGKSAITLDHLLLFTAGIPSQKVDLTGRETREQRVARMERWELEWEPGTRTDYHPFSAHAVMAELVTRVTGQDHCTALRERVLDPLGLDRLTLGTPHEELADLQPMVQVGEPATLDEIAEALGLPAVPPELTAWMKEAERGSRDEPPVGLRGLQAPELLAFGEPGASAISDAASLALFYQGLLHNPGRVWDPDVLADATGTVRNNFATPPLNILAMRTRGLGVQGDDPTARHRQGSGHMSPRTFGHGGAAGQIAWADPESGISFAYLTNGEDRHAIRTPRRMRALDAALASCLTP